MRALLRAEIIQNGAVIGVTTYSNAIEIAERVNTPSPMLRIPLANNADGETEAIEPPKGS